MRRNYVRNLSLVCLMVLLVFAGCKSGKTIEAAGTEDQVKKVVQTVLDAWKSGTSLTDFTAAHPELVIADEDWQSGVAMTEYKILEPAALNGSHWRQKTELQLKGKGKSKPTIAIYAVTLGEKTVMLRSDFQY